MRAPRHRLAELAALFFRLGLTGFGGPAAHIARMEEEVVRRRAWLTHAEFLDMLGATNLIPGPNSTEMAIHVGRARAGAAGLLVAGVAFIAPAAAVTLAFAWAYVRFGQLPHAAGVLRGVAPVIVAVVVQALVGLARSAMKTPGLAALGVAAAIAAMAGGGEIAVLLGAGLVAIAIAPEARRARGPARAAVPAATATATAATATAATTAAVAATPAALFVVFAKIGAVLFGSGYVLLAFLRTELVERRHWLTEPQLLDAIAVGQITPGPVFTTATFVGYLLRGLGGAAAATLGIFLPAFVFVAASGFLVPKIRASPAAAAFLDGVNVASLALMAVVAIQLGRAAIVDGVAVVVAVVSAILLIVWRVNSTWLILGGALLGAVLGRR